MSSLAQKMIADVNAETTARLAAIEAAAGRIEEAETLAATLRSYGITTAKAKGFTGSTGVMCWVLVFPDTQADALRQALADADLRIKRIEPDGNYNADIFLDGLDIAISTSTEIAAALQSTEEPAHA